MRREKSGEVDPLGIFHRGKAFRFLLAALALAAVFLPSRAWAASAGTAGDVSSCSVDTVPIQVMTPGHSSETMRSAAEITNALPHFRAFVTAITEHVAARLDEDKLCIHGAEKMHSAEWSTRSWFQFLCWPLIMHRDYLVPRMDSSGASSPPSCRITSPWIDLVLDRRPVPVIRGIVYWNERQLLADQAVLAGASNVPPGMAMPLKPDELGHFIGEYRRSEIHRRPTAKPVEERVSPDILWLLRRTWPSTGGQTTPFPSPVIVRGSMYRATEKGAEGYTKLVLALIDRCFASDGASLRLHYNGILDAADPILLEQYRIDTPLRR
jgi:hypothetical protein